MEASYQERWEEASRNQDFGEFLGAIDLTSLKRIVAGLCCKAPMHNLVGKA